MQSSTMLYFFHSFLMFLYIILPIATLGAMVLNGRRQSINSTRIAPSIALGVVTALLMGIAASVIYDVWLGGIVGPEQVLLTCYLAAALICFLKLLDFLFDRVSRLALAVNHGAWWRMERLGIANTVRVILLFAIGLPYMIAAAATYRPKTIQRNESPWIDLGGRVVGFQSTDGFYISALWTPAPPASLRAIPNPQWGRQTLLICPGTRGGKTSYINLAKQFLDDGYNVLTFDFRGHGQSAGQIISFGDNERRDVLGAVRWLKSSQPQESERIVAVGIDTGGAALLGAASQPTPEGQAIAALAVFGCFDTFENVAADQIGTHFYPPLDWLVLHIGVPLACIETGADLYHFSPADDAEAVAPRPILFIHSRNDSVVNFDLGHDLFESASAPKSYLWLDNLSNDQAVDDSGVAGQTIHFLDTAVPML